MNESEKALTFGLLFSLLAQNAKDEFLYYLLTAIACCYFIYAIIVGSRNGKDNT
jgi:hypothetical protein